MLIIASRRRCDVPPYIHTSDSTLIEIVLVSLALRLLTQHTVWRLQLYHSSDVNENVLGIRRHVLPAQALILSADLYIA